MTKKELRKIYLEKRAALSGEEVEGLSAQIVRRLTSEFDFIAGQNVSLFLTVREKNEVETKGLVKYLWNLGIKVFVPKICDKKLISVPFAPGTPLVKSAWGIFEPESNTGVTVNYDFIITPLLCADYSGNRVGYGKGFYDRFFTTVNPEALKIGVSLFPPVGAIEEVNEYDVPLDYLITPTESFGFPKSRSRK